MSIHVSGCKNAYESAIQIFVCLRLQVDEDMRLAACQTLQHLVAECVERREEIVSAQLNMLTTQIQVSSSMPKADVMPNLAHI